MGSEMCIRDRLISAISRGEECNDVILTFCIRATVLRDTKLSHVGHMMCNWIFCSVLKLVCLCCEFLVGYYTDNSLIRRL